VHHSVLSSVWDLFATMTGEQHFLEEANPRKQKIPFTLNDFTAAG
jgi:hypothetical protein